MEVNGSNGHNEINDPNGHNGAETEENCSNGDHSNVSEVNGLNGKHDSVPDNYKKFPYQMVALDQATNDRILEYFKGPYAAAYKVGPEKWILPGAWSECADKVYNFEAKSSDIWISTFPRSGTTWTQEMMWLLCNNLDYEAAKASPLNRRFPYYE